MGNKQNVNTNVINEKYIKWFYKSKESDWCSYSDIESAIIEEGYQNKLSEIILDHSIIYLNKLIQISNKNCDDKRSIKRIANKDKYPMREQRFEPSKFIPLVTPNYPTCGDFIQSIWTHYQLFYTYSSPLTDDNTRKMLVEKGAEGIIFEGNLIEKHKESEWISKQLINIKDGTVEQVYQCCAYLYSMESFLYKEINFYMNLVLNQDENKDNQQLWKSKITTYGPFIYLLFNLGTTRGKHYFDVYQGTNLSEDLIKQYEEQYKLSQLNYINRIQYLSFISTTTNENKAKLFGNTLFIIQIAKIDGFNISNYSHYDEEEHLIHPGILFSVQSFYFDEHINKWIIRLESYSTAGNWCEG